MNSVDAIKLEDVDLSPRAPPSNGIGAPASYPLSAEILGLSQAVSAWADAWEELAGHASEPNVFAERWFVEASARHLVDEDGVGMIGVWSGAQLVGLIPVYIASRYGRLRVSHVENWLHFHSFLGVPLVRGGDEEAFWTSILGCLDAARWALGFLHVSGLVEGGPVHDGLRRAAARLGRSCDTVHTRSHALLQSELTPQQYYERNIRKKKRKELNRLTSRLSELGRLRYSRLSDEGELETYCDDFLRLESSGWKGEAGTALACDPAMESFFLDTVRGACSAGRLEMLRLDLDRRPIAMLVNFMAPPGSFSFKIAFDEEFARFSPGVLIQLENLKILDRADLEWMDSCAAENHPMINSVWAERRTVVRVSVPLAGWRRRITFAAARSLEKGAALLRRLIRGAKS